MGKVVGFDLVEVNPMVDPGGRTCLLASVMLLEFLGAIFPGSLTQAFDSAHRVLLRD